MPIKVKKPERRVYELMCRYGEMSMRDISKKLDLDRDTVHHLIEQLRKQGHIKHSTQGAAWTPTVPF